MPLTVKTAAAEASQTPPPPPPKGAGLVQPRPLWEDPTTGTDRQIPVGWATVTTPAEERPFPSSGAAAGAVAAFTETSHNPRPSAPPSLRLPQSPH